MKTITDYCIVRHGVDSCEYFPGVGVSKSPFIAAFTGIGDTEEEAFEDALDLASEFGWDVDIVKSPDDFDPDSIFDLFVGDDDIAGTEEDYSDRMSWYVTIKLK